MPGGGATAVARQVNAVVMRQEGHARSQQDTPAMVAPSTQGWGMATEHAWSSAWLLCGQA